MKDEMKRLWMKPSNWKLTSPASDPGLSQTSELHSLCVSQHKTAKKHQEKQLLLVKKKKAVKKRVETGRLLFHWLKQILVERTTSVSLQRKKRSLYFAHRGLRREGAILTHCCYPEGTDQQVISQMLWVHAACVIKSITTALPGLTVVHNNSSPQPSLQTVKQHISSVNEREKKCTESSRIGAELIWSSCGRAQCVWVTEAEGHSLDS